MDEIDVLQKLFKFVTIVFVAIIGFFFGIMILSGMPIGGLLIPESMIWFIPYAIFLLMYYVIKLMLIGRYSLRYFRNKDLNRDILTEYPPAIYSFLHNKKIESYTDYTSTILNLECKKYLKVNSGGEYKITVLNDNLDGLCEHEKYVMNCIVNDYINFDMVEFNKKVIDDLIQLGLISSIDNKENKEENKKIKAILKNERIQAVLIVIIILLLLCLSILFPEIINQILVYIIVFSVVIYLFTEVVLLGLLVKLDGRRAKLTKKGKESRKYAYGLKRFLREYTLMNEREIEQKETFENYIAYALSLGEAKVVAEFVSKNEQYRDLIYKNKENQYERK